ncbi:hypothetical protein Efla_001922 [Eimeria flavescens]
MRQAQLVRRCLPAAFREKLSSTAASRPLPLLFAGDCVSVLCTGGPLPTIGEAPPAAPDSREPPAFFSPQLLQPVPAAAPLAAAGSRASGCAACRLAGRGGPSCRLAGSSRAHFSSSSFSSSVSSSFSSSSCAASRPRQTEGLSLRAGDARRLPEADQQTPSSASAPELQSRAPSSSSSSSGGRGNSGSRRSSNISSNFVDSDSTRSSVGPEFAELYSSRRSGAKSGEGRSKRAAAAAAALADFDAASESSGSLPIEAPSAAGSAAAAAAGTSQGGSSKGPSRAGRRPREQLPPLLIATEAAVAHIRQLVAEYNEGLAAEEPGGAARQPRAVGIRISLQKQGCSGMAYAVSICTQEQTASDEVAPAAAPHAAAAGDAGGGAGEGKEKTAASSRRSKDWKKDEVVELGGGLEIRVAADAVMLLVGTQVDFVDEEQGGAAADR